MSTTSKKRGHIHIGGKGHTLVVLRIVAWDAHGRPSQVVVGYEDSTFDIGDPKLSNEFMTAWVPVKMIERKAPLQ